MQKIYFEKWIDLNHQLNELLSLSVDESINYKIESAGVRAVGSLIVKGEYNDNQKFDESIELDVLATFDKIVDQRDFNIKVEDFDYFIKDGNIQIKIEVGIHGVVEGEERYVRDEPMASSDPLDEIENLIRDSEAREPVLQTEPETVIKETVPVEKVIEEVEAVSNEPAKPVLTPKVYPSMVEPASYKTVTESIEPQEAAVIEEIDEQLQEKVYQSKSRPIFQDTSDSVGTYYLYIVKDNDTYSEVANRYHVDEEIVRNYNQDKELVSGSVLIIPYVP